MTAESPFWCCGPRSRLKRTLIAAGAFRLVAVPIPCSRPSPPGPSETHQGSTCALQCRMASPEVDNEGALSSSNRGYSRGFPVAFVASAKWQTTADSLMKLARVLTKLTDGMPSANPGVSNEKPFAIERASLHRGCWERLSSSARQYDVLWELDGLPQHGGSEGGRTRQQRCRQQPTAGSAIKESRIQRSAATTRDNNGD